MKLHTLAQKIGLGYLLMVVLLIAAVSLTLVQIRELRQVNARLLESVEPTSRAGLELAIGLNHAVAAVRGWIITTNEEFRTERALAWTDEIREAERRLEALAPAWDTVNIVRFREVQSLLAEIANYQEQVEALATTDPQGASELMETLGGPLTFRIRGLLDVMIDEQTETFRAGFDNITARIVFLNNLEWVLLVVGLVVGILLSFLITRSVTRPVADAVLVADNIASGDLETAVNVGGSRELETLGKALTGMRDSLFNKTRQTLHFNWLSSGQNQLNEAMRGDRTPEELATSITAFMATYVGASIGSLYLVDEPHQVLSLAGGHAFSKGQVKSSFKMGEGLVGQAAIAGKPILQTSIDEQYIRVLSSLLDAPPRQIYVSPFIFEDSTLGVLELGKFDSFTEADQEFIQSSMTAVGIALNSALARQKIQHLLEETQQQSEELQQQQEELEQSNEELEEQTQKLKEQQEELQASNEEMEEQTQLIMQKNLDLETARESIEIKAKQLEVSGKYKSEFLANMSHELRTPLNSLLILANDLARNSTGNLDAEQVESAQVISKGGNDLLHLINDILDLSKVEAGKLDLNITSINIAEFASGLLRNFRRTAQEKGLVLQTVVDTALPEVMHSDRNRLEQVLNNLVSNALKFTDHGEVKISFQYDPGARLAIAVSDTGIGIPHDKQAAVFEAFVQVEGGTSRKYGGTGLGLSISRELAGLLGGKVTLHSEPGQGSTFTLTLPLEIGKQMSSARVVETPHPSHLPPAVPNERQFLDYPTIADQRGEINGTDHVVLIIEDDNEFARILASQAKAKGFRHINASTGEDGLRLAGTFIPHAIILDMELPGIDGHHVLKELKDNPVLRHIPVHIISARDKTLDPIRSGAVDYLTKPVTSAQLEVVFARIEHFIQRKMKNLLIIEDDETLRKSIRKLIGNGDVQCFEAGTAREALAIYREQSIDCIVLDVGLPDTSGFELVRQLEQEHAGELPPIIVYTGKELSRQENDELEQYAETIIVKGVKSEERLLDETALFLHRTVKDLPPAKQDIITRMYDKAGLLTGKKVLIVDDDMRNVFALSKVLKEREMSVIKAENGLRALELLEANLDMDIVLMDIMMPEMDGYECVQRIRKSPKFRDLPIVCLTAKAMKDDRQKCIDAGANDYITKPVDIDRLISLMRIWIRK